MRIQTSKDLKEAIRQGPYAWPGGYPLYFITEDGGALSFETVRQQYKGVLDSVRCNNNDGGWRVIAMEINYDNCDLIDDHTGELIECAYPND